MNQRIVQVFAPAKLNLFLHVLGRRADGYHALESVFCLLDYGDDLTLEWRPAGQIERATPLPGVDETQDLCMRAARLLQQESGVEDGVCIRLEKRLPMGGGLGGGSSDAAAVLLGLNRLWRLGWSRQRLQDLALRLGADVPIFVFGRAAFASGVGEVLQPVGLRQAWYLVLVPPVQVSTAAVFSHKELTRDSKSIKMTHFLDRWLQSGSGVGASDISPDDVMRLTKNNLQAVVSKDYDSVAVCLHWLGKFANARMTGSGACVFAVFDDEVSARNLLDDRPAGVAGFVARGLNKHPQAEWVADL